MRQHGDLLVGVGRLCRTLLSRVDELGTAIPKVVKEATIVSNLTDKKQKNLKV